MPYSSTVKANVPVAYSRAVRMLVEFYHKTPELVTEEDL